MITCSVFVATSLDGFIARSDGSLDWLDRANLSVSPGEDCGFAKFFSTVDTLIMGRKTFEQVLSFGEWAYGTTPVVVLSRTRSTKGWGSALPPTVEFSSEPPRDLYARLATEGRNHLYIDGGQAVQSFLAAGLIDEVILTVIPILLGTGRALFGPLPRDLEMTHVETHVYEFGFVQHKYRCLNHFSEPHPR